MTRAQSIPRNEHPLVSVVIPCYNYGRYLTGAVQSALDQTEVRVEVIIVDDASTDDSARVAQGIVEREPRARLVRHEVNRGHIATYNHGLGLARGEYLVLLSADDLLAPGSLGRSIALLERNPSVGFVYGHSVEFETVPPARHRTRVRSWTVWPGAEWLRQCCSQGKNFVFTPEAVMRAATYRQLGGYDPAYPHSADFLLWMRAAVRCDVGRVNGVDQAFYRVHGSNMHLTAFAGVMTDLLERRRTFARLFEHDGELIPELEPRRRAADRGMSREAIGLALGTVCAKNADTELAAGFATLARELDARVVTSRAWRRYQRANDRASAGRGPGVRGAFVEWSQSIRGMLRWRHWRWSGL